VCRFTFYRGEPLALSQLITEPRHSLIHQSYNSAEREEPLNGDGFGLAWYVERSEEPAIFRAVTPAWSNRNLRELARVTMSHCVLAHVRAATQVLEVSETNCHPFKHGRYTLMHNGDVGGFHAMRRALLNGLSEKAFRSIHGSTDSEHLFALFLDEIDRAGPDARGLELMAEALERAIDRAMDLADTHARGEPSYLNLVVSDGEGAVACRYVTGSPEDAETLYVARGRYQCVDGHARIHRVEGGGGGVLVSSEPLGDDQAWQPVPVGWWLMIPPNLEVSYRPMRVGPGFEHAPRPTPGSPA
jgi:predicted glutamine amidotransferase